MLSYANAASFSISDNKNEFILTFRQVHPVIEPDGKPKETASDVVSEIVMNLDMALALKGLLDNAFPNEPTGQLLTDSGKQ